MERPRSFLAIWTRGAFVGRSLLRLPIASGAPAQAADAPPAETHQTTPSLSPLEWNRSLVARGRVSERLGQKEDAMADYTLAIESHALPGDEQARALFDRGLLLDGMGRLDEALADYSASLSLSPGFAAALNNRANVYRRLGRLAEARHDYLAALAAGNPQSQYSYFGLGQIAEAEGGKAEAEEFYNRALAADPKYDLARDRLAALSSGEQMARLDPPNPPLDAPPLAAPPLSVTAEDEMTMPVVLRPRRCLRTESSKRACKRHRHPLRPWAICRSNRRWRPGKGPAGRKSSLAPGGARPRPIRAGTGLVQRAGDTLKGVSPQIVAVELPKAGRYYRLRVAAGQDGRQRALCGPCGKGPGLHAGTGLTAALGWAVSGFSLSSKTLMVPAP